MSKGKLDQYDIAALFHSILFAYQKTLSKIGLEDLPGSITEETIPIIERLIGKISPKLVGAESTEEALKKLAELLVASGFVQKADVTRDGENYVFNIDGCVFAEHIYHVLKPRGVTCPWAITAMAVAQGISNRKVMINHSHYAPLGTTTLIAFYSELGA